MSEFSILTPQATERIRPAPRRAEVLKARSLRSTVVLACATVILTALVSGLVSHADDPPRAGDAANPLATSLGGLILAQLLIATLGALTVTSDHSSGSIRATLIAFPRRGRLYEAKAEASAAAVGVVAVATIFIAVLVSQIILHGTEAALSTSTPHLLRSLVGSVYYLIGWGVAGFGIGAAVRRTAPAIGVLVVFQWVLPGVLSLYDLVLSNDIAPTATGQELLMNAAPHAGEPTVLGAAIFFTCFVVICLAVGWQSFRRNI